MACGLAVGTSHRGLLGDKPFRRRNRVTTEIVVPGAGNAHEALRHSHKTVKPLTETDGNDRVVLAVDYQHRSPDFADTQIRAKLVPHQEPHRYKPVVLRADIDG